MDERSKYRASDCQDILAGNNHPHAFTPSCDQPTKINIVAHNFIPAPPSRVHPHLLEQLQGSQPSFLILPQPLQHLAPAPPSPSSARAAVRQTRVYRDVACTARNPAESAHCHRKSWVYLARMHAMPTWLAVGEVDCSKWRFAARRLVSCALQWGLKRRSAVWKGWSDFLIAAIWRVETFRCDWVTVVEAEFWFQTALLGFHVQSGTYSVLELSFRLLCWRSSSLSCLLILEVGRYPWKKARVAGTSYRVSGVW